MLLLIIISPSDEIVCYVNETYLEKFCFTF